MDKLVSSRPHGFNVSFRTPTASAWGSSFVRHLDAELMRTSRRDHRQTTFQICASAQTLFDTHCHSMPNLPAFTVLGMCVLILTAYRELADQLASGSKAFELVECSFDNSYMAFIQNICKPLYLDSNRSSKNLAKMNFGNWSKNTYKQNAIPNGPTHKGIGDSEGDYHLFFREHNEPGLSQIIYCADQAWASTIARFDSAQRLEPRRTRVSDARFCPLRFAPRPAVRKQAGSDLVFELLLDPPGATEIRKGE